MAQAAPVIAAVVFGPLSFVALWCGISGLIAVVSGYRNLAERFAEPRVYAGTGRPLPDPFYARLGLASYRGYMIHLDANQAGLGIQVSRLFPFHPPLRIPWNRIVMGSPSKWRLWPTRSFILDGSVTVHISEETGNAIADAQREFVGAD